MRGALLLLLCACAARRTPAPAEPNWKLAFPEVTEDVLRTPAPDDGPQPAATVPDNPDADADPIRRAVQVAVPAVTACFEAALTRDRELGGRIAVELDVRAGRVQEAVVLEDDLGDEETNRCVLEVLRGTAFPVDFTDSIYLPFKFNAH